MDQFPAEYTSVPEREVIMDLKTRAAEYAIDQVMEFQERSYGNNNTNDYGSDSDSGSNSGLETDDGSPYSSRNSTNAYPFQEGQVTAFFVALRHNVVFDTGFKVIGLRSTDYKNCWCPW